MFTKIAFNKRLSRKTVLHIHRYLSDLEIGAHRVFWVGDRAYLETDCASDVSLLKEQFPSMIEAEVGRSSHDFPW
ncbi:hypothetical protein [Sinisalibacter lacisalsi]|uniref:hypothetical protein n=1 Tax=Sinisalibacter lacisalsi TaxID=1526570 RepID=UPI001664546F|nr:hypothetical protein [Sinisalibacter lacisalsi]